MRKKQMILDEDAVSEALGFILVFAIITLSIGIIYVVGYPAIQDSKDRAQMRNMEKNFIVLQSSIDTVALGQSPVKTIRMGLGGGTITVDGSGGALSVTAPNISYNGNVGNITYEMDGRQIIYENGGIWSRYPSGGSVEISSPKISLRKDSSDLRYLTVSIIEINSSISSVGGDGIITFTIESADQTTSAPQIESTAGTAWINITTSTPDAWARYFRDLNDTAGGGVSVTSGTMTCNASIQYDRFVMNNHSVDVRV
ncbi:MAG: DUF7289 family protein [Candidatus Syntropharchaeales archaeon]